MRGAIAMSGQPTRLSVSDAVSCFYYRSNLIINNFRKLRQVFISFDGHSKTFFDNPNSIRRDISIDNIVIFGRLIFGQILFI